jgi:hypothetical protein
MIRNITGDYIRIDAGQDGVVIREPMTGQLMTLTDAGWRELCYLLRIVGKANSDRSA